MALAGIDPLILYHEMLLAIEAARLKNGDSICGPDCGINCTATAERYRRFLRDEVMEGKLKWDAGEDVF
jgi:L-serine dehydratase